MVTATILDLLTVINELFPLIFPFSRSLFLPLRLTSYYSSSIFPFARVHPRRPFRSLTSAPSTPTIIADRFRSRNFLSSSFSVLLPTLPSFYRRIQSGMGFPQPRSTSSLHPNDDVPRRALTRESMPPTALRHVSQTRLRLKSAREYIRRVNYSVSGKIFIIGSTFICKFTGMCTVCIDLIKKRKAVSRWPIRGCIRERKRDRGRTRKAWDVSCIARVGDLREIDCSRLCMRNKDVRYRKSRALMLKKKKVVRNMCKNNHYEIRNWF